MQYLFVASGSITLFILTLIIGKEKKIKADYILTGILFVILCNFISLFLLSSSVSPFPVWKEIIFEFSEASIFLYGPLLWLYTRSLTETNFSFERRYLIHFIPFVIAFFYFQAGVLKWITVSDIGRNVLLALKLSSILVYTILCLVLLKDHQRNIPNIFSNLNQKKLNWLKLLCLGILVIACVAALSMLIDRATSFSIPQYGGIFTNLTLCTFVYILGYFGFKQGFIFKSNFSPREEKSKYSKSGLKPEKLRTAFLKVEAFMNKEQPFMDAELTLFSLADQLELKPNHLSQIINSSTGASFHDFINSYRIEEAKKRIDSDQVQKNTLLGIGLSCGFSSKSTFNRAFKKHTGLNPSEYKNR